MRVRVLADSGFLASLLSLRDAHHEWAKAQADEFAPPWHTCEAGLTEAFFLLQHDVNGRLRTLLRSGAIQLDFDLPSQKTRVLDLMDKYSDVPMSLADACLVRMSEMTPESVVLTTDSHFRTYRRNGRQVVPHLLPR